MHAKTKVVSKALSILNKRLGHDYFIGKKIEAGMVLLGTEVKALRLNKATIDEAFVRFDKTGRAVLFNAHISDYSFGNVNNHDPLRTRFLLLNKSEINEIRGAIERKGESVLISKIYFKNGIAKAELAICKSKKNYDKRHSLKLAIENREAARALRRQFK